MVLGQGTAGDVYQSIMVKPPNIKPVYPMVKQDTRVDVTLDEKFIDKEYVYVFNLGKNTPDNAFYNSPEKVAEFLEGEADTSLTYHVNHVIVAESEDQIKSLKNPVPERRQVVIQKDPTNFLIQPKHDKQKFIWVAECTQANFISSFVEHRAAFLGYAQKTKGLNTKRFNCHKVTENQVGHAFDMDDKKAFQKHSRALQNFNAPEWKKVNFFAELIVDQSESK